MALVKCAECGRTVSSKAKACPTCGAPPAQAGARIGCLLLIAVLLTGGLLIWGGLELQEKATTDEAGGDVHDDQTSALDDDPRDHDATAIPDCSTKLVWEKGLAELSTADQVDVCTVAMRSFEHPPSVRLLRRLLKAVTVLTSRFPEHTPKDVAYQIASIIEARGHSGDEHQMASTIDTVFKIATLSDGHVSLTDLNVELRAAGDVARTMSDEGLIGFAALVWEFKRAQGE